MKQPKWGAEEYLLAIIGTILILIIMWFMTACSSTIGKTDTLRFRSERECTIYYNGQEMLSAHELGIDFTINNDCSVTRKLKADTIQEQE